VRRRSLLAVVVVAVLALVAVMPAAALADGSSYGHQGVHAASLGLEIESGRAWCATAAFCSDTTGAKAMYAFAGAYRYDNMTHATPNELYGECDQYWTDSMGVRHEDYAQVDAYSVSGLLWLMNSGSESNINAMAAVNASGFGGGGFLQIQGYGQFNNDGDMPYAGTNFTVTIIGTIYHETWTATNGWLSSGTSFGSMTCQTQAEPTNSLFPPFQYQPYVYGEAETND